MKLLRIIFLIAIFATAVNCSVAQQSALQGEIKYLITENWIKKYESLDYINKQDIEKMQYRWGKDAEYKSYAVLKFDTLCSRYELSNESAEAETYNWAEREDEYIIYRNRQTNEIYDFMRFLGKLQVIEDSVSMQKWKIENQMKEIAGHICMSASTVDTIINNNKIVAWFALDIPYFYGPERYCGLPGLILEININNGAKVLTAESITLLPGKMNIEKPSHKKGVKKINATEFGHQVHELVSKRNDINRPYFYDLPY